MFEKDAKAMMNFQKMMQQAQQMQSKLAEMQEKLGDHEVVGESGGGMVKATMNGRGELLNLDIDPSVFAVEDKEMSEDLIVAAVNSANARKEQMVQDETRKMMESLGLPAGTKLPGM